MNTACVEHQILPFAFAGLDDHRHLDARHAERRSDPVAAGGQAEFRLVELGAGDLVLHALLIGLIDEEGGAAERVAVLLGLGRQGQDAGVHHRLRLLFHARLDGHRHLDAGEAVPRLEPVVAGRHMEHRRGQAGIAGHFRLPACGVLAAQDEIDVFQRLGAGRGRAVHLQRSGIERDHQIGRLVGLDLEFLAVLREAIACLGIVEARLEQDLRLRAAAAPDQLAAVAVLRVLALQNAPGQAVAQRLGSRSERRPEADIVQPLGALRQGRFVTERDHRAVLLPLPGGYISLIDETLSGIAGAGDGGKGRAHDTRPFEPRTRQTDEEACDK